MLHARITRFDVMTTVALFGKLFRKRYEVELHIFTLGLCLVREMKIFGCHIGCFEDIGRGFRILIKKTNYIALLETTRRIY